MFNAETNMGLNFDKNLGYVVDVICDVSIKDCKHKFIFVIGETNIGVLKCGDIEKSIFYKQFNKVLPWEDFFPLILIIYQKITDLIEEFYDKIVNNR